MSAPIDMLLGIDLGTTFSASASVGTSGIPVLTPDRRDATSFHTPSVVHLGPKGALVGEPVERLLEDDPGLPVARFAKASMGTDELFFSGADSPGLPAHAISALILSKLRRDFAERHGAAPEKVVVTVPAHFNERQRQATSDAARLAGLPLCGLIEEPVAAAAFAAASRRSQGERTLMVFDLGGGTLDATLLQASGDSLYVLATEGAPNVGGRNFDEIIMNLVRSQFQARHGAALPDSPDIVQRLRQIAVATKMDLSKPGNTVVRKHFAIGSRALDLVVSRSQFEEAARLWLEACEEVCSRLLGARRMGWQDVDFVTLTGGSSQMPCIERLLRDLSGLPPDRILREHPRSSIAYGASLLGEQLFGDKETIAPLLRQTVSSNELGLRAIDPLTGLPGFEVLVPKNRPLPASGEKTFFADTKLDDCVAIEVLQRKDEFCEPETLSYYRFGPLPPGLTDRPIEVTLSYDKNGRAHVRVVDQLSGIDLSEVVGSEAESDLREMKSRLQEIPLLG